MLARCDPHADACLTLTALHPDGQHPTPSRHIPLSDNRALDTALTDLLRANALGWGAYVAVGLRRPGLTRWRRGGLADVVALPALFVDVDDPSPAALARLEAAQPRPSCLVFSGGGYHAYWWLDEPTTDLNTARLLVRGLAAVLGGDRLSPAQSLRLVGSVNSKPARGGAVCRLLDLSERRYPLSAFSGYLPRPAARPQLPPLGQSRFSSADLSDRVAAALTAAGYQQRGNWLNGHCPFPERHAHGDARPSFGFHRRAGVGYCFVCGLLPLAALAHALYLPVSA